tara:strand:- start:186 stop:614 length:429 start_codon:yes stop_codon:yes gene_type:complete
MSKGLGIQLAKARQKIKQLEQRVRDWEDWFQQGADNHMVKGDPYQMIFHDVECPNAGVEGEAHGSIHADHVAGEDCAHCWLCETNRLTHNKHRQTPLPKVVAEKFNDLDFIDTLRYMSKSDYYSLITTTKESENNKNRRGNE